MSDPHLPQDILDHTVDLLHDARPTLMNCCLVSKSWIPRTRKHLFANITFPTKAVLQKWKETFPDPSTSPTYYTKTLFVGCHRVVTAADAEVGGWITGFSRVVNFRVESQTPTLGSSLVPFYGFSPVIESLHLNFAIPPSSQTLELILSFPLLEDLTMIDHGSLTNSGDGSDDLLTAVHPSSSPALTGSLHLSLGGGIRTVTRSLLSLPGGIHFRKLNLTCYC